MLSPAGHDELARRLVHVCLECGFFKAIDHDVPPRVARQLDPATGAFFARSTQEKQAVGPPDPLGWCCGAVVLASVVLWVLSTRICTLLLCGRLCVSGDFPYVRVFADMPLARQEAALLRWKRVHWLFPLWITFTIVRILRGHHGHIVQLPRRTQR